MLETHGWLRQLSTGWNGEMNKAVRPRVMVGILRAVLPPSRRALSQARLAWCRLVTGESSRVFKQTLRLVFYCSAPILTAVESSKHRRST